MVSSKIEKRFLSPFDVATPPGCEGWEKMYPYYMLFSQGRREFEDQKFWLCDLVHHPEPFYPLDLIWFEGWWMALSQYNTRVFIVPPALGLDNRILNGYAYISANSILDPKVIEARVPHFMERAGYYYQNWDTIYQKWEKKMAGLLKELEELEFKPLPEMVDMSMITESTGLSPAYDLLVTYDKLFEMWLRVWQYHFECLNLGYAAYLFFMDFCKKAFPDISDQTVTQMVSGVDVLLFRGDSELRKLAKLAFELNVVDEIQTKKTPEDILARLNQTDNGRKWVAEFEKSKEPWFRMSTGTGFYHTEDCWIDNLTIPFGALTEYTAKLGRGESIDRPLARIQEERDRITGEYFELLRTEEDKAGFKQMLGTARMVFFYVENHVFYVENWFCTSFYRKLRNLAGIMKEHGFIESIDDIFYINRHEIREALYDLCAGWASGTGSRGPSMWPEEIAKRKEIIAKLREWSPPPALGVPPEVVTEPFTVMLWGVTSERVQDWLSPQGDPTKVTELKGFAGSPGVAEGPARVIRSVQEIDQVQPGEILVCTNTSPSWVAVFVRIKAAVTDVGGMMSHAAIVCREYGVPSVNGTGYATKAIKTGQMIRVDGTAGTVSIIG